MDANIKKIDRIPASVLYIYVVQSQSESDIQTNQYGT